MDIDSSPTLVSPCHAYATDDDDEPPTLRLPRSAPPPTDEPTLLDAESVDADLVADSDSDSDPEPATLRSWRLTPMPGSVLPMSSVRATGHAATPRVRR